MATIRQIIEYGSAGNFYMGTSVASMNILITGGAGYFGSILCGVLMRRGFNVTCIDTLVHGDQGGVVYLWDSERSWQDGIGSFRVIQQDFRSLGPNPPMLDHAYDVAIHLACPRLADCEKDAAEVRSHMVANNWRLHAWAEHVIYISSCSVYGNRVLGVVCDEVSAPAPNTEYAKWKLLGEKPVLAQGGTVLRFGTLCGWSPVMRWDLLMNAMMRSAAQDEPFQIFDPLSDRPYLHILDAARAVREVCINPVAGLFIVSGHNYRKQDLITRIAVSVGRTEQELFHVKHSETDTRSYAVDAMLFRDRYGWNPVGDTLERTLDDFRQRADWGQGVGGDAGSDRTRVAEGDDGLRDPDASVHD